MIDVVLTVFRKGDQDWTCRYLGSVGKEEVRQLQYNDVLKQPQVHDHERDSVTTLVATRKLSLYRGGRQIHDFGSKIVTGNKSLPRWVQTRKLAA